MPDIAIGSILLTRSGVPLITLSCKTRILDFRYRLTTGKGGGNQQLLKFGDCFGKTLCDRVGV